MFESEAFKTYRAYATGKWLPSPKATKNKTDSESSPKDKALLKLLKVKEIQTSAKGDQHATTKLKVARDGVYIFKVPDDNNKPIVEQEQEITDAQTNQETEEAYVTLTTEPPVVQQQSSSVSSDLVAKFINPSPNTDGKSETYNSDKDFLYSYGEVVTLKRGRDDQDKDKEPSAGSNRGSKRQRSGKEESSKEATQKESKSTSSSKGTTISPPKSSGKSDVLRKEHDPRIQHLTQDLLTGLTYDLIKGTCKSVVELECHLEEVFKATNDQLDWHNLEGRPYPHDLSKPLPLILDARGCLIIPYDHFINNDLEYLKGGSSSCKYTTLITKIKAADYGHIKWIEDKIPRSDFKRLRREDIEDMLLLLVQGKLTNLNVDERFVLNVALRMYTRRIVIQERIIYQDDMNKNRLMRTDELHKFSDGTLNHVRTSLNDIATGIQMEYFPKRKWSKQDKQRAGVMIKAIDKKLKDRRLMRSLESLLVEDLTEETFGYYKGPYDSII
ncbi:hypothetical protein Tco_1146445 [Tanacetum coccineum]